MGKWKGLIFNGGSRRKESTTSYYSLNQECLEILLATFGLNQDIRDLDLNNINVIPMDENHKLDEAYIQLEKRFRLRKYYKNIEYTP